MNLVLIGWASFATGYTLNDLWDRFWDWRREKLS